MAQVPSAYLEYINKRIQERGDHCVEISGYMPVISAERASRPQWGEREEKKHVPLSQLAWMRNSSKECSIIVLSAALGEESLWLVFT